jgi:hypothetical protein
VIIDKKNFTIEHFLDLPFTSKQYKSDKTERKTHLSRALNQCSTSLDEILEFGVNRGWTMGIISEQFKTQKIYGFDSFEGLPEKWSKGSHEIWEQFSMKVDLPVVGTNVELVKGWYNESISTWKKQDERKNIKFIHIDCDLYSSTKTVFEELNDLIKPNTIVCFDEFYSWTDPQNYSEWRNGEFKALKEWVEEYDREIQPLFRSRYEQCTVKVIK